MKCDNVIGTFTKSSFLDEDVGSDLTEVVRFVLNEHSTVCWGAKMKHLRLVSIKSTAAFLLQKGNRNVSSNFLHIVPCFEFIFTVI